MISLLQRKLQPHADIMQRPAANVASGLHLYVFVSYLDPLVVFGLVRGT